MNLYQTIQSSRPFFLIAGPCVIESPDLMLRTAEYLVKLAEQKQLMLIFKSSFQKANRTSGSSYSGPGREEGLKLLQKIKQTFDVPILTDIHETNEIEAVSQVADILQIPAFLSRQTALLQAAGLSGRIVNIKKGQFMAPEDMLPAAAKITATGNPQVMLTERGTSFGYHNLVVDFRSFAIMKTAGFPVIYDVTHSLQMPSAGAVSGGTPQYVPMMAKAAISTGMVDGLFIETHPDPETALSDAASMLRLDLLPSLLDGCIALKNALER